MLTVVVLPKPVSQIPCELALRKVVEPAIELVPYPRPVRLRNTVQEGEARLGVTSVTGVHPLTQREEQALV